MVEIEYKHTHMHTHTQTLNNKLCNLKPISLPFFFYMSAVYTHWIISSYGSQLYFRNAVTIMPTKLLPPAHIFTIISYMMLLFQFSNKEAQVQSGKKLCSAALLIKAELQFRCRWFIFKSQFLKFNLLNWTWWGPTDEGWNGNDGKGLT